MIIKNKPANNFTILRNGALERKDLSLKAKGLYAFLMSKPDGWNVSIAGLASQLQEGESSIGSALKELEVHKYYRKKRVHNNDGTFSWETFFYDEPQKDSPYPENPCMDNPVMENEPLVNTDIVNTDIVNNSTIVELGVTAVIEAPPTKIASNGELVATYGNPDIQLSFDYWQEVVGYELTSNLVKNRYACKNILKKTHGIADMRRLIDGVAIAADDKYAPRIADFCELQSKINELMLWGRKNNINQNNKVVSV